MAAVFIINENGQPQVTFAWILLFFARSGIGILVYCPAAPWPTAWRPDVAITVEQQIVHSDLVAQYGCPLVVPRRTLS